MDEFTPLGLKFSQNINEKAEVGKRVLQGRKNWRFTESVWCMGKKIGVKRARSLHESVLVASLMYGGDGHVCIGMDGSKVRAVGMGNMQIIV